MSNRNVPSYRNSYIEHHLTDDESSESASSYLDDYRTYRRDSTARSIRSSRHSLKNSPQRSLDFDDDSETFSRRSHRGGNHRDRRASSSARSLSSRSADKRTKSHRLRSDSTQDSENELGTKALVQAKIREKVAQQSSLDESSSDFWKPQTTTAVNNKVQTVPNQTTNQIRMAKKAAPSKNVTKSNSNQKLVEQKQTTKNARTNGESNVKQETETNATVNDATDNDSLPNGPPPKTPNYAWECEFCTFTNEANTKICAICCKTPTTVPVRKVEHSTVNATTNEKKTVDGKSDVTESTKGRTKKISRKISFWPGTKSK